uniref:RAB6-interacting golgin-like n=1 Tax=Styela clava TaxID=7725 RepID=UPI001939C6EE|nr:RAB6-interacting golgin-like [Styela clava]
MSDWVGFTDADLRKMKSDGNRSAGAKVAKQSTDKSANDTVESEEPEILEDAEVIKKKEKIKLEDIQQRQKQMEEKNKRKKTMLTKAIAERKKRAFAESTKLVKIQAELTKLDGMLNYDVSLLRDRIDEACVDYNHAQKRFDKAEAEYISAKMNLHKATQMKEELTEHLFHLIQLNEERKANKLEELMQKLELDESEEIAVEAESSQTDSKFSTESTADNNKDVEAEPSNSLPDSTQSPTVNETNDNIEVKPKEADEIK